MFEEDKEIKVGKIYTPTEMLASAERLIHWQALGEQERAQTIVYSKKVFEFMWDTPEHQEVIATLTFDNCVSLERRNKP